MPLPTLISELSTTAASNFPAGSDSPSSLDDVQRAHAAFIATIRDTVGLETGTLVPATARTNFGAAASGALASSGITGAAASGANADITSLTALTSINGAAFNKNVIINGGFTINQRGYVSAAALASGAYGHDRFKAGSGGGDYSFTQLASNTTITIAANKTLIQVVEDKNVHSTRYVVSWTGTALGRVGVNSATPSGSYAASPIVITGQTAGTTMSVEFGNGASAGTLGSVQVEATTGSIASAFEHRPYGMELALCQRYYRQWSAASGGFPFPASGQCTSTGGAYLNNIGGNVSDMRALPTVTSTAAGTFSLTNNTGAAVAVTSLGAFGISAAGCIYNTSVSVAAGLTAGDATFPQSAAGSACSIFAASEL